MGIHYSEFDVMFEFLKEEIPIPLNKALEKWEKSKRDRERTQQEWIKLLEEKSRVLMDEGYSVGTAMLKSWDNYYGYALEDCQRDRLSIVDLRDTFFEDSLYMLEKYEDNIVEGGGCECYRCGWFTWDYRKDIGYCNNFCTERKTREDRCISEGE